MLEFEETWRDTCLLLQAPALRGPRQQQIQALLAPLEQAMGGQVEADQNGRFYLRQPGGRLEMPLVAEGLRKLAMLARLITTGELLEAGMLFWDEPEANLNPRLLRPIAQTILALSRQGLQVFMATHSPGLIESPSQACLPGLRAWVEVGWIALFQCPRAFLPQLISI